MPPEYLSIQKLFNSLCSGIKVIMRRPGINSLVFTFIPVFRAGVVDSKHNGQIINGEKKGGIYEILRRLPYSFQIQ
ncbi:hypothetical protein ASZ90_018744 [hydrocarbon metagenome]|uniref:Uncharacterized protein n=1 Tax=hydrocarbon metagenome TaxID=938273 RepID=A0A0W8E5A3_9ZZZZ